MTANTRMKDDDRDSSIKALGDVLNAVPQFVKCPISDKTGWVNAYHDKFPRELFAALELLEDHGYKSESASAYHFRIVMMDICAKPITTLLNLERMGPAVDGLRRPLRINGMLLKKYPDMLCVVNRWDDPSASGNFAMKMDMGYLERAFGFDAAAEFRAWAVQTADLQQELKSAKKVINEIFSMAKTAGQIKRMVPELLQYLPPRLRDAYAEQKRASSMPFEWAPYDKAQVERMILTVSKGHLLRGLGKPELQDLNVSQLNDITWGHYCNVKVA